FDLKSWQFQIFKIENIGESLRSVTAHCSQRHHSFVIGQDRFMKTERLYYNDPYLLEFDANIVETKPIGDRFGIVLDKTAFYPTSGGQPNDLGANNDIPLIDCVEEEDTESVIHVVQ